MQRREKTEQKITHAQQVKMQEMALFSRKKQEESDQTDQAIFQGRARTEKQKETDKLVKRELRMLKLQSFKENQAH